MLGAIGSVYWEMVLVCSALFLSIAIARGIIAGDIVSKERDDLGLGSGLIFVAIALAFGWPIAVPVLLTMGGAVWYKRRREAKRALDREIEELDRELLGNA